MKLSIRERISFNALLPKTGDILGQSLVKSLQDKVQVTPEEIKLIGLRQEGTMVRWDEKKDPNMEITFSKFELDFLKEQVKKIDAEKRVTQDNLSLLLKIREENIFGNPGKKKK